MKQGLSVLTVNSAHKLGIGSQQSNKWTIIWDHIDAKDGALLSCLELRIRGRCLGTRGLVDTWMHQLDSAHNFLSDLLLPWQLMRLVVWTDDATAGTIIFSFLYIASSFQWSIWESYKDQSYHKGSLTIDPCCEDKLNLEFPAVTVLCSGCNEVCYEAWAGLGLLG